MLLKGSPFNYRDGFSHIRWYPPPEVNPTHVASLSTAVSPPPEVNPTHAASLSTAVSSRAIETENGNWECGTVGSPKSEIMDA